MTAIDARPDMWACPDAVELIPTGVTRADWLVARRRGIGGSDAATVAGLNPYSSRYELWLDKTGQIREKPATSAMDWGNRLEPVVVDWFVETTGIDVRKAELMAHRERDWQLGNVDRLTADGGILEVKNTSSRQVHLWDFDQVPDAAELQGMHYLAVTGRSHVHFAVLVDGRNPMLRRVERDEHLIEVLSEMEREFWENHVVAKREPTIDGSEATENALGRRWPALTGSAVALEPDVRPLLDEYEEAKAEEARGKARARQARSQIAALVGSAETATVHGEDVLTFKANGTFSSKSFTAENPELAAELTTLVPGLDMARLKSEHHDLYTRHRARVLRRANTNGDSTDG